IRIIFAVGDDVQLHVVEEGVARHIVGGVGRRPLSQPEHEGEGAGGVRARLDVDGILHPAVGFVVRFGRGVDVRDLHLVEGLPAHGVGDADVRAPPAVHGGAVGIGEVGGLDPYGQFGGSARLEGNGGGGGVPLRRAVAVRAVVVDHQHARLVV